MLYMGVLFSIVLTPEMSGMMHICQRYAMLPPLSNHHRQGRHCQLHRLYRLYRRHRRRRLRWRRSIRYRRWHEYCIDMLNIMGNICMSSSVIRVQHLDWNRSVHIACILPHHGRIRDRITWSYVSTCTYVMQWVTSCVSEHKLSNIISTLIMYTIHSHVIYHMMHTCRPLEHWHLSLHTCQVWHTSFSHGTTLTWKK